MQAITYIVNTMAVVFFFIVLSYYGLLFIKPKKTEPKDTFKSITIIIPAHNEEPYIQSTLDSVLEADFPGEKQIIVVDDGSKDKTAALVAPYKKKGVLLLRTPHRGKSASINLAMRYAKGEVISIVDGDSCIHKDALIHMIQELGREKIAACTGVIKVKNRRKLLGMWLHIEQVYNSLIRLLFCKLNANIVTPGPLSMYRRKELEEIGGFSTDGFSEDVDVTIRLIRKGHRIAYVVNSVSETNMPYDAKGFLRQRTRFIRGTMHIFKRHLRINKALIDIYTLPLLVFMYVQAVVMAPFNIYQIISGYFNYFVSYGIYFNFSVLKFFFEWFSIIGFARWVIQVFSGSLPANMVTLVIISTTLLTYPLYLYSIIKFDRRFDLWHLIPLVFMFPFWLIVVTLQIICLPEYFRKRQYNIWKKNE